MLQNIYFNKNKIKVSEIIPRMLKEGMVKKGGINLPPKTPPPPPSGQGSKSLTFLFFG
ncbi:MAG: hypothetical protein AB1567_06950 [bacterium]